MSFENITRILLPKDTNTTGQVTNAQNLLAVRNPDDARARRNKLAALSLHSKPLKKAA